MTYPLIWRVRTRFPERGPTEQEYYRALARWHEQRLYRVPHVPPPTTRPEGLAWIEEREAARKARP